MSRDGRRSIALPLVAAVAAATAVVTARPGRAAAAPGVTLRTNKAVVDYSSSARLRGAVSPPSEGETVVIIDELAREVARATTDADGRYSVVVTPRRTVTLRARWVAALSPSLRIRVRPVLSLRLTDVRLFGRARVRGSIRPAHEGARVAVRFFRRGRVVAVKSARLRSGRRFAATFPVKLPGRYQARVVFNDADHARASERSARRTTRLPSLSVGSRSIFVRLLERRLDALGYHLRGIGRRFDHRTADAVRAFNKVRRRARLGSVDASTWREIARAGRPSARFPRGSHVEVDQTRQVLFVVRKGVVRKVVHVSTGANGYTHDGRYSVFRKIAGYSGGRLYYPSYFDGLRAVHGWPQVPVYPASHGCVRVPMWTARFLHGIMPVGTRVLVYH